MVQVTFCQAALGRTLGPTGQLSHLSFGNLAGTGWKSMKGTGCLVMPAFHPPTSRKAPLREGQEATSPCAQALESPHGGLRRSLLWGPWEVEGAGQYAGRDLELRKESLGPG